MLNKKDLQKLADKYDALHEKNYRLYQECGEPRYLRASERYEDMADAFQMAADVADIRQKYHSLSASVSQYAAEGDKALYHDNADDMKQVLRNIVSVAEMYCGYWSAYKDMKKNL